MSSPQNFKVGTGTGPRFFETKSEAIKQAQSWSEKYEFYFPVYENVGPDEYWNDETVSRDGWKLVAEFDNGETL